MKLFSKNSFCSTILNLGLLKVSCFFILILFAGFISDNFITRCEKSKFTETTTYKECIEYYKTLESNFDQIKIFEYGTTDVGKPLHLVVISKDKIFNPEQIHKLNKRIVLVNNGIHPGEPEGIDASMILARNLLSDKNLNLLLENVVLTIIPVYNIGGCLNRNSNSRVNQNGPAEYGFRGNAINLDLNRDFIKSDSKNTIAFSKIFHDWDPDIFIDTHTSNGSDYQYVMTYILTQPDKLNPNLSEYTQNIIVPFLKKKMKETNFEMSVYVNTIKEVPDSGLISFLETPRYSTGYAALFNTIGFVTETHMLKEYETRVWATYHFIKYVLEVVNTKSIEIGKVREKVKYETTKQDLFTISWLPDTTKFNEIDFKGYAAKFKTSDVTGVQQLYYDQKSSYNKKIRFYGKYKANQIVEKPLAYIIPQQWDEIIERLKLNKVDVSLLNKDTLIQTEVFYIKDYKTSNNPYEGHYFHYDTEIRKEIQNIQFYKGDVLIFPNQKNNRYIIETLDPRATDSFFNWNFFDNILQQKEYFSSYIFDEFASEIIDKNSKLKQDFTQLKSSDSTFAKDNYMQLDFIYKNSEYFEKSFQQYPVYRLIKN